jgi:alpha-galactosidase
MGEMEIVYELKVVNGKITGAQKMPFGDAPIVDGKIEGDQFELIVEMESFGNLQRRTVTGKIVENELHIVPAMPGPPPGMGPGGQGRPEGGGPPGARPAGGPPGGGPGGTPGSFMGGPVIARRGAPTPSYRAPSGDYRSLPKVELPTLKELPVIAALHLAECLGSDATVVALMVDSGVHRQKSEFIKNMGFPGWLPI